MRKTYIILGILVVVALALYLVVSYFAKGVDQGTATDINTFLNNNGYIIPESERKGLDIQISQYNDDMYKVVMKYDGLHDDSVSGMEKTLILERIDAPEKFKLKNETNEYTCSRGKTDNGLCI